jgi:hypothetical protein
MVAPTSQQGAEQCERIAKSNDGKDHNNVEMLQANEDVQLRRAAW